MNRLVKNATRELWIVANVAALVFLVATPLEMRAFAASETVVTEPRAEEMAAAKLHFDSGARFFEAGNYTAARTEFEAAYTLSKLTPLLYNLARTAEKQGQIDDALRYLEAYLATNPTDAEEVKKHVAELKQREERAARPMTGTTVLGGGPSWLKGTAKRPPVPALVAIGAGAAFLAVGIGCGVGALSIQKDVASASKRYWTGDVAILYDDGKLLNSSAIAFDVLGGALLAGGAIWTGYWLYLLGKQPSRAALPTGTMNARVVSTGNGFTEAGSF